MLGFGIGGIDRIMPVRGSERRTRFDEKGRAMHRFHWILVALVLASMLVVGKASSTSAQDATPISVPTVTVSGCDQVPAYAAARQQILDEMLDGIAAIFPTVATPIIEHGDQLLGAMMAMTPDQLGQLSAVYDETGDKIEKLDAPAIADFYNEQVVDLYRLSGRTFAEAQKSDLMTAGSMYGAQLDEIASAISTYGDDATAVCPAFADVVAIDQTRIGF